VIDGMEIAKGSFDVCQEMEKYLDGTCVSDDGNDIGRAVDRF
jgi:hypothetical protein